MKSTYVINSAIMKTMKFTHDYVCQEYVKAIMFCSQLCRAYILHIVPYMVVEKGNWHGEAQGSTMMACFVLGQISEEIKLVALAIIELCSYEGIST